MMMKKEIQKWMNKGYKWAYTHCGQGLEYALKHKLVACNEEMARKQADNPLVKNKNIEIFSLREYI